MEASTPLLLNQSFKHLDMSNTNTPQMLAGPI